MSALPGLGTTLIRGRRWQTSPVTGERDGNRYNHCVRERRVIPVYSFTRVLFTNAKRTRGCGCNGHPAFPTPSLGEGFMHNSGASRRGAVKLCLKTTTLFENEVGACAKRSLRSLLETRSSCPDLIHGCPVHWKYSPSFN